MLHLGSRGNVLKTKAPISYVVTVQLICAFVFAYAKSRFSHDATNFYAPYSKNETKNNNRKKNIYKLAINMILNHLQ